MSLFNHKNKHPQHSNRRVIDDVTTTRKHTGAAGAPKKAASSAGDSPVEKDGRKKGAERQVVATLTLGTQVALHRQVAIGALARLLKAPVATVLSSLLIAVAFALPVLFFVLVSNLQTLGASWDGQPGISVYLDNGLAQEAIDQLIADYRQDPLIKEVSYISPQQGLADFQQRVGLQDIIGQLGSNPLPGVIELVPISDASVAQLDQAVLAYQGTTGVDQVRLDRQWVQRLQAILSLLERFSLALGIILGLTVVLVISNTVRLSIESRRDEIRVVSMVGGTRGFIAMPFIYMGMWYGIMGALLAHVIVFSLLAVLRTEAARIAGLYGSEMVLSDPGLEISAVLLFCGTLLGAMGALGSCYRHFQTLVPN